MVAQSWFEPTRIVVFSLVMSLSETDTFDSLKSFENWGSLLTGCCRHSTSRNIFCNYIRSYAHFCLSCSRKRKRAKWVTKIMTKVLWISRWDRFSVSANWRRLLCRIDLLNWMYVNIFVSYSRQHSIRSNRGETEGDFQRSWTGAFIKVSWSMHV